jgi:hypothetical protein
MSLGWHGGCNSGGDVTTSHTTAGSVIDLDFRLNEALAFESRNEAVLTVVGRH